MGRMAAVRRYAGYAVFAVAVLGIIAWVRMPSDVVRSLVLSAFTVSQPGMQVRCDAAELTFPPGVMLMRLSMQTRDGALRVDAESLSAYPALLSLLTGRLAFRVQAVALGGQVDGNIAFRERFSASGPVQTDIRFARVSAADCPWLVSILGRDIRGRADGRLRFDGLPGRWTSGAGRLELVVVDGVIPFQSPIFGLPEMSFTRLEGDLDLGNGSLRVNRLHVSGESLQGAFRGHVRLGEDLPSSRLALRGDVNLPSAGAERFAVEVAGTVASPVVTPL